MEALNRFELIMLNKIDISVITEYLDSHKRLKFLNGKCTIASSAQLDAGMYVRVVLYLCRA